LADTSHLKPGQKMTPTPAAAPAPAVAPEAGEVTVAHAVTPAGEHAHPGPRTYIFVAAWLAIATAIEVGLYYIDMPAGLFIGALMLLMIIKFTTVVAYFMHLKYDAPIFRRLMITGIILAIAVYMIVLTTFGLFR
jgi:cytochrome c oxidase subunit 4